MGVIDLNEKKVVETDAVLVVGAGLVGSLTALTLARRGIPVIMVERSDDWEVVSESTTEDDDKTKAAKDRSALKRSINLALSFRGKEALRNAGVLNEAMEFTIPMHGRALHTDTSGEGTEGCQANGFQPYDETDGSNFIHSVGREHLNKLLVNKAREFDGVQVIFGMRLTHVDRNGVAHFEDRTDMMTSSNSYNDYSQGRYRIKPKLVLGCDGAYSVVRESLLRLGSVNFERQYISHGYKELNIPPNEAGDFALRNHQALHIWPRGDFMMIGLPNPDHSFTCTIFAPLNTEGNLPGLLQVNTEAEIKAYFQKYFPDVPHVMPDYIEQFQANPSCRLVMLRTDPWNHSDKLLILGDAAHAQVPFYGQGMNSGFEDVLAFDEVLTRCGGDLSKAVPVFAKERAPDGHAICDLSMRNYVEMRSHTASTVFLLRKKLEGVLNLLMPKTWVPLYKMVAFTRIPYAQAVEREERQSNILRVLLGVGSVGTVLTVAKAVLWMGGLGGPMGLFSWRALCGCKTSATAR